jgi:acetyltransferase-like isoleucine patch superfamily enzyme
VVINPLASISGGVVIGDRTLIGTAAAVLQYINVGSDASVGAGAVVTKDVADGTTVVGVPARPTPM